MRDTRGCWERFGRLDPYFAVLTQDQYHRENLSTDVLERFFESGRNHIDFVLETIKTHLDPSFHPRRALDFGCGVGRSLVHLASIANSVVGVDVSDSMLQEAERNCDRRGMANVSLAQSDDALSGISGTFDLIHAYLVFQHIAPKRVAQSLRRERIPPTGNSFVVHD